MVAAVEAWDISGDSKFESCWPACLKDCNGVIIVAEALSLTVGDTTPEKSVEFWYHAFAQRCGLEPSQVMVALLASEESVLTNQVLTAGRNKLGA